ncbi:MAG: hypothetical protein ACTTI6_11300 [Treponema sp.]|uniref:hypothetical protein n=1 Tax=Treponema sp. TaxID=166 RepID=UPI003FA21F5E
MNKEVEYQEFIRNYFNFGTAFSFSFFDLPENYNFSDITEKKSTNQLLNADE